MVHSLNNRLVKLCTFFLTSFLSNLQDCGNQNVSTLKWSPVWFHSHLQTSAISNYQQCIWQFCKTNIKESDKKKLPNVFLLLGLMVCFRTGFKVDICSGKREPEVLKQKKKNPPKKPVLTIVSVRGATDIQHQKMDPIPFKYRIGRCIWVGSD